MRTFLRDKSVSVILVFCFGGLIAGLCFGSITRIAVLANLWFIKADKFYVPSLNYWIGSSVSLLSGLIVSYVFLRARGLYPLSYSVTRLLSSALIIGTAFPLVYFLDGFLWMHLDWSSVRGVYIFVSPVLIAILLSISLWILTKKWDTPVFVLITLACFLTSIFSNIIIFIFSMPWNRYEVVLFPLNHSLLSALFGYWLTRGSDVRSDRLEPQGFLNSVPL